MSTGSSPTPTLVRRWSTRTFDSYARYWCDGARLPYESEAGVRARWQLLSGHEHLRAAMDRGRGIVMALPHVGQLGVGRLLARRSRTCR